MDCPHASLKTGDGRIDIINPLKTYLTCSKTCQHCNLLLRVVEAYKPGWMDRKTSDGGDREIKLDRGERGPHVVSLFEVTAENARIEVGSFRYLRKPKDEPLYDDLWQDRDKLSGGWWPGRDALYESLDVTSDSSSAMAIDRISKWLSHCVENDELCQIPNPKYMPHRLVNVGSNTGRDPFLFEPKSPVPYVCLSYCWGTDNRGIVKTLQQNLTDHYKGITLSHLPKTIRDTIHLCRGLKLENLWIDSLCIVQDDDESWLQDAAQMYQVYANSHLTIAGLEPYYCQGGILGEQKYGKPEWQRTIVTDVAVEVGGPGREILLRPEATTKDITGRSSLDSRGWCLQESILPNRRICFDGHEMTWECVSRKICECGHVRWAPGLTNYGKLGRQIKHPTQNDYWSSSQGGWMGLVEDFSKRSLTKETDKLVAVSGLAKLISHSPQAMGVTLPHVPQRALHETSDQSLNSTAADSYVAGLWREMFILELAWRVNEHGKNETSSYLAPSWSWASVTGSVLYDFREAMEEWENKPTLQIDCSVDEVVCEAKLPSDPTGAVKGAHTILTGPLVPVELINLDESLTKAWEAKYLEPYRCDPEPKRRTLVRAKNMASVEVFLDRKPIQESCLKEDDIQADCWIEGWCERKCCAWDSGGSDTGKKTKYYCLRLFSWKCYVEGQVAPSEIWFLVLRRSQLIDGAYERVGVSTRNQGYENRARYGWTGNGDDPEYCPLFDEAEVSSVKIV